jgi:hypothetical protein
VTKEDRKSLNPKYAKRIVILQKLDTRGRSKFFILHRTPNWGRWSSKLSMTDIPKYSRVRYTLNAAENVAFKLIKNYEKIFMS